MDPVSLLVEVVGSVVDCLLIPATARSHWHSCLVKMRAANKYWMLDTRAYSGSFCPIRCFSWPLTFLNGSLTGQTRRISSSPRSYHASRTFLYVLQILKRLHEIIPQILPPLNANTDSQKPLVNAQVRESPPLDQALDTT